MKHVDFAHRVNVMKFSREGRTPTPEFVKTFKELIEEELRMVEADEMVVSNRKKAGLNPDEIHVNMLAQPSPEPKGRLSGVSRGAPPRGKGRTPKRRTSNRAISANMSAGTTNGMGSAGLETSASSSTWRGRTSKSRQRIPRRDQVNKDHASEDLSLIHI